MTDNTVSYLKNGLVFHTIAQVPGGGLPKGTCPSCATPTFPMHADFILASVGDGFTDVNMLAATGTDYVDFIFTFDDANTWCSGYRQSGHSGWGSPTFTKDIQIYTSDDFDYWALVKTDTHSAWHNGGTNTFPDDGTTSEWTPTTPSKYLRVRTLTNHGDTDLGGRVTVRFLQLKFAVAPY